MSSMTSSQQFAVPMLQLNILDTLTLISASLTLGKDKEYNNSSKPSNAYIRQ